jgi:membrane protease YdiL (CAAX protease family)
MLAFFAIAFGAAWACQVPVYLLGMDGAPALALLALGGIAPSVAGVIATRGRVLGDLARGPRPWWGLAAGLFGPTLLVAAAGAASGTLTAGAPYLGSILLPPIGEELGWRGYLQPRLVGRAGLLPGTAAVAAVWGLWHLPAALGALGTFPPYFAGVFIAGLLLGGLWARSGGSLLACVAAHAGLNLGLVHAADAPRWAVFALAAAALLLPMRGRTAAEG